MKHFLDRAEFYITNVCNYNCEHCNRFNNYHFKGHQYWKDFKNVYKQWNDRLDLGAISILGGEPTLNPSIIEWIDGIATLWTTPKIEIVTNGTRLNYVKELYNTIKKHNGRVSIYIGLHDRTHLLDVQEEVYKFLDDIVLDKVVIPDEINELWQLEYNKMKYVNWPDCPTPNDFKNLPEEYKKICEHNNFTLNNFLAFNTYKKILDKNGVQVEIHIEDIFHESALNLNSDDTFTLHDSEPVKAHEICFEKHNHHFVKGNLYKCNVSAVLPMFQEQYNVNLTVRQRNVINNNKFVSANSADSEIQSFINNLKNKIPMCSVCPERPRAFVLKPSTKKIKVKTL
jgi:organic radical activating enzyme